MGLRMAAATAATSMAEAAITEQQLALLLQAARDFAFEQMARDRRLIPFAARVKPDGDIEFARFAEPDTESPLDDVYRQTQAAMADQAGRGEIIAAGVVAAVALDPPEAGFAHAIRVHVEAPGFSRQVLVPYGIEPAGGSDGEPSLKLGKLVPQDVAPVVFAG